MSSENWPLQGKRVVVLGASRGVGREIVQRASADGAQVLVVARQGGDLAALAKSTPGIETLALDAATEAAPPKVFRKGRPDLLVICGGATPPVRPMPELTWAEFSVNWEVDAKMAFLFCREALAGSAGCGLGRRDHFQWRRHRRLADLGRLCRSQTHADVHRQYVEAESDRRELGIRFMALVPSRIMPETDLGRAAVNGYAQYLGVTAEKFLEHGS